MQRGVQPNGLFWTTEIPTTSFRIWAGGTRARLQLSGQPLVDTIEFGSALGLSSIADIDLSWRATAPAVERGFGNTVPPDDFGAFTGHFADADCSGSARGKRTGFSFKALNLDSSGFFAELGPEKNGVHLV